MKRAFGVSGVGIISLGAIVVAGCGAKPSEEPAPAKAPNQIAAKTPASPTANPRKDGPRVSVQHGFDSDAAKIDKTPRQITVEQLLALRDQTGAQVDLDAYHNRRVGPFETSTYEVTASIKSIKHEKDGDFYMVLKGKSGAEAVVEVPDPALCQGSPLLPEIEAARKALDERYHPTDKVQDINETITVDGVGYLGSRRKPGSGSFGSSVRLMPGTGVKFNG